MAATTLVDNVLGGDIRAAARLMRDIDDRRPAALDALKELYPRTGRAYITGVTGNPGAGKSTVVDGLIAHYRAQGARVGVVAVDPTSPFSGGAILGDRIRMQDLTADGGVFMRSMASRGNLGGLAETASGVADVMDAAGFEVVLIETVGAGQDVVEVATAAQTTVLVATRACVPRKRSSSARRNSRIGAKSSPSGVRSPGSFAPRNNSSARVRTSAMNV